MLLEDIISRYRLINYTLTTNTGELKYLTCLMCWNLDVTRKDKFVLEPLVFCIVTASAFFRFSSGILKQVFSLTVFPSLTNLLAENIENQIVPLEFHLWLLLHYYNS